MTASLEQLNLARNTFLMTRPPIACRTLLSTSSAMKFVRTLLGPSKEAAVYSQVLAPSLARPARRLHTSHMASLETLRERWTQLYRVRLPSLAKARDPAQTKWPVQLDHCFARIILDAVVGKDKPWTQALKSPAYKNMDKQQLEDAIALGEKLAAGEEDLVALDETSLALRGKMSKQARRTKTVGQKKRMADEEGDSRLETKQVPKRSRKAS